MSEIISTEEYTRRIQVWCAKGRAYDQLPKKRRDRWILLHAIRRAFSGDDVLSEAEVNERLRKWLAGVGQSIRVDAIMIRRELIDGGFLERDAAGREYRASRRFERILRFEPGVEELDIAELIESRSAERDEQRRSRQP
jgi:hypothetical protein